MPTPTTAAIYPGACLVEATNLSEGRGTTRPFQLIGAPWLDGEALAKEINAHDPPGARFRAALFRPEFGKHAGQVCSGVEWHVVDRAAMRPLDLGVRLLGAVARRHPDRFAWRDEPYEFVSDVPAIDLLTGSGGARAVIEGRLAHDELRSGWDRHCEGFRQARRAFLLHAEA